MQTARLTVTKEESRFLSGVLKDFELICYCEHFTLCFWSGSKANQIVAQMDPGTPNEVSVDKKYGTWCSYLEEVVQNAWREGVVQSVCGGIWSVWGLARAAIPDNQVPAPK